MLDLVEVTIDGMVIDGDADRAERVLRRIGELKIRSSDGNRISLFNKPHGALQKTRLETSITRAGKKLGEKRIVPVFGGKLVALRGRNPTDGYKGSRDLTNLSLRLSLNVTRFLSAQKFEIGLRTRQTRTCAPLALACSDDYLMEGDEIAFGGDRNVLMGSRALYAYAASKRPTQHLMDLIDAIIETICDWIEDNLDIGYNRLQRAVRHAVSHVEWYAEFEAHDPRRVLAGLMPMLTRLGPKANVFRRRLTGQVRQFGPHSYGLQIELSAGKKQTTYSKTSRRIRFEVKYRRASFYGLFGRRTRLSREEFERALKCSRGDAIEVLRSIFGELARLDPQTLSDKSRDDLGLVVGAHTESLGCAEEILRSLRQSGRVSVESGSILRPSVDRLIEVGVLRYIRQRVYSVTDEYGPALRELMNQPGAEQSREDG